MGLGSRTLLIFLFATAQIWGQVTGSDNGYSKSYGPLVELEQPTLIGGEQAILKLFVYPDSAREQGIAGTMLMSCVIDESGSVHAARALLGPEELMRAAEDAVEKSIWIPAKIHGEAVAGEIKFFLDISPDKVEVSPLREPEKTASVFLWNLLFASLSITMFYLLHTLT